MLCKIIPEKCIACGLCQIYAPNFFDYDDEGIVLLKNEPIITKQLVPLSENEEVLTAYRKCPVRAIEISDK
ncbi:ferredoxin [Enterococcus sp. LJL99]